jgi:hypothetical protein
MPEESKASDVWFLFGAGTPTIFYFSFLFLALAAFTFWP